MDLIIQEAKLQVQQNNAEQDQLLARGLVPDVASTPVPHGDTVKVVGLKEETKYVIEKLISHQSNRQIIPIVGMGGIGKTTLAANVYNHTHLSRRFDVKSWVTVSQVYTTRTLIAPLLHGIGVHGTNEINDEELGDKLYKGLFGRRYLVIIDDIWDVQAWYDVNRFFPENNNGSRIILTTRLSHIAISVGSCTPFDMQLLDVHRSWDLLSKTVFEEEVCPPEFEQCGKEIAKNCKGLPLAIVVIGGLLKVSDQTQKHWEHVGRNIRSIIATEDNNHCMKIMSLSYHQLPIHLKPCFLYMAVFPEDYNIKVSEVSKLWAAEGFLKPTVDGESLDDVALKCLFDLVRRNLVIMMNEQNLKGEVILRLTVHDIVRDLCMKEAQNEKFLYVDDGVADLPTSTERKHRLVFHGNGSRQRISRCMRQMELSRSFIWSKKQHPPAKMSGLSLLRVIVSLEEESRVEDIRGLVNLRLLKFSLKKNSFSSISWALNLETLILNRFGDDGSLPVEIWNLWRLKHLIVYHECGRRSVNLPNPPTGSDFVHESLQTLEGVRVLSDIVLNRIPNIKSLDFEYHPINNFVGFGLQRNYKFPSYLTKLTLRETRILWENMTIVGSLPNLDSLSLEQNAFIGGNPIGFRRTNRACINQVVWLL